MDSQVSSYVCDKNKNSLVLEIVKFFVCFLIFNRMLCIACRVSEGIIRSVRFVL